ETGFSAPRGAASFRIAPGSPRPWYCHHRILASPPAPGNRLRALTRSSRAAFVPLAVTLACFVATQARAVAPFTLELVDSNPAGSVGESSSLKVDHLGHPHVAYYDGVNGNLKYAFHDGTNWVVTTADGSTDDVGEFCALALDSLDRPHIAYYDGTHQRLMYTRKLGATGAREVVDTAGFDCSSEPP